ncbi:MAG: hypothetical protein ACLRRK_06295 [Parasutterella sp.]
MAESMIKQRTLKKVFSTVGIGLHSGRKVRLTLRRHLPIPVWCLLEPI